MDQKADIFYYARQCVDNKGIAQRVWHSGKLHDFRSAVSDPVHLDPNDRTKMAGAGGSKLARALGAAARSAIVAISPPILGSLIASAEEKVEDSIRKYEHQEKLKAATTANQRVKFELKDLSVEELDRYRWKVNESMLEFLKKKEEFKRTIVKRRSEGATCEACLELALALEQAARRITKLRKSCVGIRSVIELTEDWLDSCEQGNVQGRKVDGNAPPPRLSDGMEAERVKLREIICGAIQDDLDRVESAVSIQDKNRLRKVVHDTFHQKCGSWCYFRLNDAPMGKQDNWAELKTHLADMARFMSSPATLDAFDHGSLWAPK